MSDSPTPGIGRIVWYRTDGRNGLVYDLPAMVTCTILTHPGDYPFCRWCKGPVAEEHGGLVHVGRDHDGRQPRACEWDMQTQYAERAHNPLSVPSSERHVHLTVFTPGGFGAQLVPQQGWGARDPESDKDWIDAASLLPGSGTYVELDVPQCQWWGPNLPDIPPRSWRWPERS